MLTLSTTLTSRFIPAGNTKRARRASRRRAFTSEWTLILAIGAVHIAVWSPIVARFTGWSQPISVGVLTLLAFALALFCGAVGERDPRKAYISSDIFLAAPAVLLMLLLVLAFGGALWRKLF